MCVRVWGGGGVDGTGDCVFRVEGMGVVCERRGVREGMCGHHVCDKWCRREWGFVGSKRCTYVIFGGEGMGG